MLPEAVQAFTVESPLRPTCVKARSSKYDGGEAAERRMFSSCRRCSRFSIAHYLIYKAYFINIVIDIIQLNFKLNLPKVLKVSEYSKLQAKTFYSEQVSLFTDPTNT